jgi:hypothetical protein
MAMDEEEECMDRFSGSLMMQEESMLFDAGGFDQMQNMRQEQKLTFKVRFRSKKLCTFRNWTTPKNLRKLTITRSSIEVSTRVS